jgi:hypothetical protein
MNVPIRHTPGQAVAVAVTLDNRSPYVFGSAPHRLSDGLHSALHRLGTVVINALVVLGWLVGIVTILALASPTLEGHIEDFFVSVLYELT